MSRRRRYPGPVVLARSRQRLLESAEKATSEELRTYYLGQAAKAEESLSRLSCCRRCGRALTNPLSQERHYGPDCFDEIRAVEGSPTTEGATP